MQYNSDYPLISQCGKIVALKSYIIKFCTNKILSAYRLIEIRGTLITSISNESNFHGFAACLSGMLSYGCIWPQLTWVGSQIWLPWCLGIPPGHPQGNVLDPVTFIYSYLLQNQCMHLSRNNLSAVF